ncbi:type VI secretion system ATPase TssH, partial [bacterium]
LTEAVRRRPYSVVLFDEIEKAHPEVFNALLQILEDGRMTDGQGRTVDFKNTVIIMTSNLGSQYIQDLGEKDRREMERRVTTALREAFKPEFLNRIDETVIFNSLGRNQIKEIVGIQLRRLARVLADKKMSLDVTEQAKDFLSDKGYDPVYGARPLKRTIQKLIQDPLALKILEGEFREGERIRVDSDGSQLTFSHGGPVPREEAWTERVLH